MTGPEVPAHIHCFELEPWHDRNTCTDCGKLAVDLVQELEQEVAETRAEYNRAMGLLRDIRYVAEMRKITTILLLFAQRETFEEVARNETRSN